MIMLTKQNMSSDRLCGPPLLLCPAERLEEFDFLPSVPTEVLQRNALTPRCCEEYKKTAALVEKAPWRLFEAAAYLRALVENNQQQVMHRAPLLHFIGSGGRSLSSRPVAYPGEWEAFAPRTPTQVVVKGGGPPQPKRRRIWSKTPAKLVAEVVPSQPGADGLPPLGCSKCRLSPNGCAQCKKRRAKAMAQQGHDAAVEVAGPAGAMAVPAPPAVEVGEEAGDPMEICSMVGSGGEDELLD